MYYVRRSFGGKAGHPFELALMDGVATRYNADEVNAALAALCQEQCDGGKS